MIVVDDLDKECADDDGAGGTLLRLFQLMPFDYGLATPASSRGARLPTAARLLVGAARHGAPPESSEGDFRRLVSQQFLHMFQRFAFRSLFSGQNLANFRYSGIQQKFSKAFNDKKDVSAHNWRGHSYHSPCKRTQTPRNCSSLSDGPQKVALC